MSTIITGSTIEATNIEATNIEISGSGLLTNKAYVSYNNISTITTYGSEGVSSITDLTTGSTRVNLSTAAPDTGYFSQWSGGDTNLTHAKWLMNKVTGTTTSEYQSDASSGAANNLANNYVTVGY